jgi:biopolymer transport protein ExbB/TolQ
MMMDFIGEFIAAIAEVIGWMLLQMVLATGWVLWMVLVTVGRLLLGAGRLIRRSFKRQDPLRELALALAEYHEAVADIRRIGADTRRQIRALSNGRRP